MALKIKILKAGAGDSILLSFDGKNILIDGGAAMPYHNHLKREILELIHKQEQLDLVIATHFDEDHINGLYNMLEDIKQQVFSRELITEFWFHIPPRIKIEDHFHESTKIGVTKAKKLENLLTEHNWREDPIITSTSPIQISEQTKLFILSPNTESLARFKTSYITDWESPKLGDNPNISDYSTPLNDFDESWPQEDVSISNGSSIAFLIEYENQNVGLFLGDAFPSIVVESLKKLGYSAQNKLAVDYVKLSHHGSCKSLSKELLELIECSSFIISTSGSKNHLPNKKTFSHILDSATLSLPDQGISFLFNYEENNYERIFHKRDFQDFQFNCQYSNYPNGLIIEYD